MSLKRQLARTKVRRFMEENPNVKKAWKQSGMSWTEFLRHTMRKMG